jgi:polysaccharide pyruvyl transferase WcaK-like protein
MEISVKRIGAEYLLPDFEDVVKELLTKVSSISVRSSRSAEIIKKLGFDCILDRDYAFDLDMKSFVSDEVEFPKFEEDRPLIGVVTAGNNDLSRLVWMLRILTIKEIEEFPICNFIHIPHVRHYTDWRTNDVIGGEILWSGINIYHGKRWLRYQKLPFPETVEKLLNSYLKVDGIIGMRYHSFIFSQMVDKPMLAIVDGSKAEGYFLDNKRNMTVPISGDADEETYVNSIRKFFDAIRRRE